MAVLLPAPTTVPPLSQETLNLGSDPLPFCLCLPSPGITGACCPPAPVCAALRVEPPALCMLSKHSSSQATSLAYWSSNLFVSFCLYIKMLGRNCPTLLLPEAVSGRSSVISNTGCANTNKAKLVFRSCVCVLRCGGAGIPNV